MGAYKLPNRRMYWSPKSRISVIADAMTRNRFDQILSILHFCENSANRDDKTAKIKPVLNHFNKKFQENAANETYQAINEMMIAFKGRHSLKVYMPKKPTKWGYKLWCRAGVSGYVYQFELSGGLLRGPTLGIQINYEPKEAACVVLRLTDQLESGKHKIFFDNLFGTPELLTYLKTRGIFAVSTLRNDRTRYLL